MGQRRAWLLNFEADLELAQEGSFTPGREVARLVAGLRTRHAGRLLAPEDVEVDEREPLGEADRGLPGEAWCPTPGALARLERAGAVPPAAPPLEVLRRVNDRAFNAELGLTLPGAEELRDLDGLRAAVRARGEEEALLLKRGFSVAGRGQLRVRGGELDGAALAWARAAFRGGRVQLEPRVTIERELVLHGRLTPGGELLLGRPCVQDCDARGTWLDTRPAKPGEVEPDELEALARETERVAAALASADYFGPFGVDAFRWLDGAGARHFQPRSEINARYTLGWRAGFPLEDSV